MAVLANPTIWIHQECRRTVLRSRVASIYDPFRQGSLALYRLCMIAWFMFTAMFRRWRCGRASVLLSTLNRTGIGRWHRKARVESCWYCSLVVQYRRAGVAHRYIMCLVICPAWKFSGAASSPTCRHWSWPSGIPAAKCRHMFKEEQSLQKSKWVKCWPWWAIPGVGSVSFAPASGVRLSSPGL
jgi:hypothetical protein